MPKVDQQSFRSVDEYQQAIFVFCHVCSLILIDFAKRDLDLKNLILRNFVARTSMMLAGVMSLWGIHDFQDCWILFRSMLDRLFHLVDIDENDRYQSFDDWSFYEQCKTYYVMRSDPQFREVVKSGILAPTPSEKERYKKLAKNPPKFKRPKAEDVAKKLGLSFLYKFGYDYASTHVHPMANDGLVDFFSITNLEPPRELPNQISVLHNSILVGCLIIEKCLTRCDFNWRGIVSRFFNSLMDYLRDGSEGFMDAYNVLITEFASKNLELSQPKVPD